MKVVLSHYKLYFCIVKKRKDVNVFPFLKAMSFATHRDMFRESYFIKRETTKTDQNWQRTNQNPSGTHQELTRIN